MRQSKISKKIAKHRF